MATRVISREPKDPQCVSRFPLIFQLRKSLSQECNRRRYWKTQWNLFKVFIRCFVCQFAGNCTKKLWKMCRHTTLAFGMNVDFVFRSLTRRQASPWTTATYGSANLNVELAKRRITFIAIQPEDGAKRNGLHQQSDLLKSRLLARLKVRCGDKVL